MTNPITQIHDVLRGVGIVDDVTPTNTLRMWRTEIVRASVLLSCALGIYSLDAKILEHAKSTSVGDVLEVLVGDLPQLLATGWVGGGWSLSPDASISVAAAAEFDIETVAGQLALHGEMVASDLKDYETVDNLCRRIEQEREVLIALNHELAHHLKIIQKAVLQRYLNGTTSVDDWLA